MKVIFKKAAEKLAEEDWNNGSEPEVKTRPLVPLQLLHCDREGRWDPLPFREDVRLLLSFSLIRQYESRKYYSMHRVVHFWAQDRLSEGRSTESNSLLLVPFCQNLSSGLSRWKTMLFDGSYFQTSIDAKILALRRNLMLRILQMPRTLRWCIPKMVVDALAPACFCLAPELEPSALLPEPYVR